MLTICSGRTALDNKNLSRHSHSPSEALGNLCVPLRMYGIIPERLPRWHRSCHGREREEGRKREQQGPLTWLAPSKCRRGRVFCCWPLSLHINIFSSLHVPAFSWQRQAVSPVYQRLLVELLSMSSSIRLLDITLERSTYHHTKAARDSTEVFQNATISTSNLCPLSRTFHCTERHCFSHFLTPSTQELQEFSGIHCVSHAFTPLSPAHTFYSQLWHAKPYLGICLHWIARHPR